MPKPTPSDKLIKAIRWADDWVSAVGQNCCVGRSQGRLRDGSELRAGEREETADDGHRTAAADREGT
jgi:hypothetical protein